MFSKLLKSGFLKLLVFNIFLGLIAWAVTRPIPSRAKRFAEKRAKRYFDEESLRDEIKILKRENMCPNEERYLGTDLDFYSCDLGKVWGFYGKTALVVRKQPTNKGEYFCLGPAYFTLTKTKKLFNEKGCEEVGGIFYESARDGPCSCLIPYDF